MDTLDYTGPTVNEGSKGVLLGLGDPVRELPREFRAGDAAAAEVTRRARLLRAAAWSSAGRRYARRAASAAARFAAHPAFARLAARSC